MKDYLTINEFAKLRNVNANSIRYYEKLKILEPAWIDPQTKYRYYLPEQLVLLDTITLCIKLGIPLKSLKNYMDETGALDEKRILEAGKKAMQDKISEMQQGLELTQFNLDALAQNQEYSDHHGIYAREIGERFFVTRPFSGNWDNLMQKERAAMELFYHAQDRNMAPVFPSGILAHGGTSPLSFSFYVQVLYPSGQDEEILHLPKARYLCMQTDLTSKTDIARLLEESFPRRSSTTAIIASMPLKKRHLCSRHCEVQILDETSGTIF